jgi:hypothetical protein
LFRKLLTFSYVQAFLLTLSVSKASNNSSSRVYLCLIIGRDFGIILFLLNGIINKSVKINANVQHNMLFPSNLLNSIVDIAAPDIDPTPLAMNTVPNSVELFRHTSTDIIPSVE